MILVMLGTQNNDFHRLLDEVEKNIENGNINEEVIVQAGYTKFISDKMKIFSMTSKENLKDLIKKADLITVLVITCQSVSYTVIHLLSCIVPHLLLSMVNGS